MRIWNTLAYSVLISGALVLGNEINPYENKGLMKKIKSLDEKVLTQSEKMIKLAKDIDYKLFNGGLEELIGDKSSLKKYFPITDKGVIVLKDKLNQKENIQYLLIRQLNDPHFKKVFNIEFNIVYPSKMKIDAIREDIYQISQISYAIGLTQTKRFNEIDKTINACYVGFDFSFKKKKNPDEDGNTINISQTTDIRIFRTIEKPTKKLKRKNQQQESELILLAQNGL